MPELLIGWAEVDTTPAGRVDLSGQYYHRLSEGVHSRLAATVLALEGGAGAQAVMVSLELVGFGTDFLEELRGRLRGKVPGLDPANLIMNVTHTHNAPGVDPITGIGWLKEPPGVVRTVEYREFLLGKLVTAIAEAWRGRKPGGVANALGFARVGHCRRAVYADGKAEMYGDTGRADFIGMEGGEDSGVDMLFTFGRKPGKPTGVILNLACPSQILEATYKISSDFIGEARRLLKQRFGRGFKVLGQIAAAGCQSPRDLTRNYRGGEPDFWREDGVAEMGRRLLAAVENALPFARSGLDMAPELRHSMGRLELPLRRASRQDCALAREELQALEAKMPEDKAYADFCRQVKRHEKIPGRPGPYDSKLHHFVLIRNARAVIERYEEQQQTPDFSLELHVLRLGRSVFATNPFELYLEYGQRLKARSPAAQTFVIQLCGGTGGYLPSARAEQLGGYGGLIINGKVGSEGGSRLVDLTLREINRVWKAN